MDFPDIPQGGGGGNVIGKDNFIKLGEGQSITGVFRGTWSTFFQHYDQAAGVGRVCQGRDKCPDCANNQRPTFRGRINFVVKGPDSNYAARVFEVSAPHVQSLKDANQGFVRMNPSFKLDEAVIVIARSGAKKNTRYAYTPATQWQLSPQSLEKIKAVALISLDPGAPPASQALEPGSFDEQQRMDDIPF